SLGSAVLVRRQPQIESDDRRLVPAQEGERRFPVPRDQRLGGVEAPAHLLLQARIVLDDQQHGATLAQARYPSASLGASARASGTWSGRSMRNVVPCFSRLS